jgi:hypothetical protein
MRVYEFLQEAKVRIMPVANFSNSCDVLRKTHTMVDVESLVILKILYDLLCVKIDKDCVLLHLESIHLDEGVPVLLQTLESFLPLH